MKRILKATGLGIIAAIFFISIASLVVFVMGDSIGFPFVAVFGSGFMVFCITFFYYFVKK